MGGESALVKYEGALSVEQVRTQVNLIQAVMASVMKEGQHYGKIPGCGDKPTLLKPGAEKLSLTFRLRLVIDNNRDVSFTDMGGGHREIRVYCHILNSEGVEMSTGVGSCSTMESKYRYRGGEKKPTGKMVPKEYWNLKKEGKIQEALDIIGGKGFGVAKIDGTWQVIEFGEKMENPDIADTYNTVLKIAKKRAYIDGILSATAASDIFTQDIEDMVEAEIVPTGDAKEEIIDTEAGGHTTGDAEPKISDKQGKMLYAKWKAKEIPDDEVKKYLKNTWGIEHTKDIAVIWFDDILRWIENWKAE